MSFLRIAAAILALLLLGSCTLRVRVKATFAAGRIVFVSNDDDDETHAPWCWNNFAVLDGEGQRVWAFDAYYAYRDAKKCGPNFPLAYGQEPRGAVVTHGPQQLRPGTIYVLTGLSLGMVDGAFTLYRGGGKLVVRNLRTDSDEVIAIRRDSDWRERGKVPVTK